LIRFADGPGRALSNQRSGHNQSSSGFDRSSGFRPVISWNGYREATISRPLVGRVGASEDGCWADDEIVAVQLLEMSFDEYQDFHADIVQMLRCAGIGQTSLIRATDP
jgi:hypothetical protein